jgi:hypothetical protein
MIAQRRLCLESLVQHRHRHPEAFAGDLREALVRRRGHPEDDAYACHPLAANDPDLDPLVLRTRNDGVNSGERENDMGDRLVRLLQNLLHGQ